jgi:nitrate reductase delta subunit
MSGAGPSRPTPTRAADGPQAGGDRASVGADVPAAGDLLVLRALAALLAYPRGELFEALPEIADVIARSPLLDATDRARLADLVQELRHGEPLALEERYVALFDRGRATSLHLFEHVHGESRDRGAAMVDLVEIYGNAGLRLNGGELPDYLPAVLEYLSCRTHDEVRAMLGDCAHIVRKIGEALAQRGSRYAAVPAALLSIAGEAGVDWRQASEPPPAEPPIDEEWAEAPAFGPADAGGTAVMQFVPRETGDARGTRRGGAK